MLAHGIAKGAGIGKPDRFGAAAAARRSHNLLICYPAPFAHDCRVGVPPSPPATVRRLAPPSHSPPRHTWAGHLLTWWLHGTAQRIAGHVAVGGNSVLE